MGRSVAHPERCSACKAALRALLERAFGEVVVGHGFDWPTRPRDYAASRLGAALQRIHDVLVAERGHTDFVGRARIPPSDYFIPSRGILVELDESQHFTARRAAALAAYPRSVPLGFARDEWLTQCRAMDRRDSDPHRDETRAWYDTLRDLVPSLHGMAPTVRLRAGEIAFCKMNARSRDDLARITAMVTTAARGQPRREGAVDWSIVKPHHVASAIAAYGDGPAGARAARSTFLLVGDRRLAAKFVRGLAYELATGNALDPSRDYAGGMETVQFFVRRGYAVEHEGRRHQPNSAPRTARRAHVARVAGISVEGDPWPTGKALRARCAFLEELPRHLPSDIRLDAVQLPGGFLTFAGKLPAAGFDARKAFLERQQHPFATSCLEAAARLERHSPGAALCVGIDSPGGVRDQLNVAWRPDGVAAIARKIFPTDEEGEYLVCEMDDFVTPHRYMRLRAGRTALLCACYDVYGCADHADDGKRPGYVQNLSANGRRHRRPHAVFFERLHESLAGFRAHLDSQRPRIVLAAIHQASTPQAHTYWHKHGLPDASATLDGALVVGAVHFRGLSFPEELARHPYAVSGVSRARLRAHDRRARDARKVTPIDEPSVVPMGNHARARIAIFES